jgi:hypothetical protein
MRPVGLDGVPRHVIIVRRVVAVCAVAVMLGGVVRGYVTSSPVLAWQMFPEASTWEAEIVRVAADGREIPIDESWPGGYEWGELVTARGLGDPEGVSHAAYGIEETLAGLREALDWVALNTPLDAETVRLRARVTYRHNDDQPRHVVIESVTRRPDD